jgi:hypothetical protein
VVNDVGSSWIRPAAVYASAIPAPAGAATLFNEVVIPPNDTQVTFKHQAPFPSLSSLRFFRRSAAFESLHFPVLDPAEKGESDKTKKKVG